MDEHGEQRVSLPKPENRRFKSSRLLAMSDARAQGRPAGTTERPCWPRKGRPVPSTAQNARRGAKAGPPPAAGSGQEEQSCPAVPERPRVLGFLVPAVNPSVRGVDVSDVAMLLDDEPPRPWNAFLRSRPSWDEALSDGDHVRRRAPLSADQFDLLDRGPRGLSSIPEDDRGGNECASCDQHDGACTCVAPKRAPAIRGRMRRRWRTRLVGRP